MNKKDSAINSSQFLNSSEKQVSYSGKSGISILLSIFIGFLMHLGCGLPTSELPKQTEETSTVKYKNLTVHVTDGVLKDARVRLVSVLNGIIASGFTNSSGNAVFQVQEDTLKALQDDDVLYLYADSMASTTVTVSSTETKNLLDGQAKLKSYLPSVATIKTKLPFYDELCDETTIKKNCTVSHFSNAKAIMMEQSLKNEGTILQSLRPDSAYQPTLTAENRVSMVERLQSIDITLATSNAILAKKFKFIAVATKAIIEQGIAQILAGSSYNSVQDCEHILMEIAGNTGKPIQPMFSFSFADLYSQVNAELTSSVFSGTFNTTAIATGLAVISSDDTKAAAQMPYIIPEVDEAGPGIDSNTQFLPNLQKPVKNKISASLDNSIQIAPYIPKQQMQRPYPTNTSNAFQFISQESQ
jgi:hypothetical protein